MPKRVSLADRSLVRRIPTQARSRERLDRILSAAIAEFGAVGVEAATMESIAARAETSIGSVYQFFPNKAALFDGLCEAQVERGEIVMAELLAEVSPADPWEEVVSRCIDRFWKLVFDSPAFRVVWTQRVLAPSMLERTEASYRLNAEKAEQLFAALAPDVDPARRRAAASLVIESGSAVLFTATRRPKAEAMVLIGELKSMLISYLRQILPEPSGGVADREDVGEKTGRRRRASPAKGA